MLELLQTAPVDQLPQDPNAYGAATGLITDNIPWIGFFTTVAFLGRRWLMGELLPEDMTDVDLTEATADRKARDRWRAWVLYGVFVVTTTAGVYLLTALAWALLWVGLTAFAGAVAALWGWRGGTPVDDVRLLALARRRDG